LSAGTLVALALLASAAVALTFAGGRGADRQASAAVTAAGHWRLVFSDDFRHGLRKSSWGRYSGQPGGDPGGFWDPSHVTVRRGILTLDSYRDSQFGGRWVSGGVSSSHALRQRYGRYSVRFRMDRGKGIAGILLLWPSADVWPPEVDFAETGGISAARDEVSATLHYGTANHQIQRSVRADFTRWHVLGVEWTPRRLVYTLDGRPWATVRSTHVPKRRMEMDIQAQAGTCGDRFAPCPDSSTPKHVRLQVDRVAAYAYHPAKAGS
jgi:beta-glucanase (GH16 family)